VALTYSGDIYTWGSNNNGQMGINVCGGSEDSIDAESIPT